MPLVNFNGIIYLGCVIYLTQNCCSRRAMREALLQLRTLVPPCSCRRSTTCKPLVQHPAEQGSPVPVCPGVQDKYHLYFLFDLMTGGDLMDVLVAEAKVIKRRIPQGTWKRGPFSPKVRRFPECFNFKPRGQGT